MRGLSGSNLIGGEHEKEEGKRKKDDKHVKFFLNKQILHRF